MAQNTQRQIATQSSIKLVLDWGTSCNKCLTLKELVGITNVIVDYVENGYTKEIGDRLEKIQEHIDNKKFPTILPTTDKKHFDK
jgi:hypothetical protein